jgi:hypothetical protein
MVSKFLFWFPRALTILAILFMMLFSFDAFGGDESFGKKVIGFLIHNIPVFILTLILFIAWKRELIGGILFILASFAASVFFKVFSGNYVALIIVAPFFLTGVLFIINHYLFGKGSVKE